MVTSLVKFKHAKSYSLNTEEKKLKYPKSIFFIIGNEFCERFTYYGLRTVLTIYLIRRLLFDEPSAMMIYHFFAMLAYFSPVIGAIIADSWLGKFSTILYLSILYAIGCIVLSFGAFPNELSTMKIISLLGLFIIGLGTGGIKPCVSAFGGDQFKEGQEKQLQQFFSLFYLAINLGSLVSTYLTPYLREDVHCLGENSCFPLAFGVPAFLMVLAIIIFICGKPLYKIRPPSGNVVVKVSKCIAHAICRKMKSTEKKKAHWLDYADDKFDSYIIGDIKILFHVLVLYIPLPLFWALFDQQGSSWTIQATKLDGSINGYHIKPDHMQIINPLFIILFIPLFEYCVYPLLAKCKLLTKPLQKMTVGGLLAAVSFIMAGFIQLKLEAADPIYPASGRSELTIINNSPCFVNIEGANMQLITPFEKYTKDLPLDKLQSWTFVPQNCSVAARSVDFSFNSSREFETMMITVHNEGLIVLKTNDSKAKDKEGLPLVRLMYSIDPPPTGNVSIKIERDIYGEITYIDSDVQQPYGIIEYCKLLPGSFKFYFRYNETHYQAKPVAEYSVASGGRYIISIYNREIEHGMVSKLFEMVKGNFLKILVQIPQYAIITAGEIMFSITGLEFSYSQAPVSMKSVLQSAWLLTVAFGNVIVMIIAKLHLFNKKSSELFLFAALMGADMIVFAILAYFYKYGVHMSISSEHAEAQSAYSDPKGSSNEGYVEETDLNK